MKEDVPRFVHDSSYPDGWEKRQYDDLARVLDAEPENVDVAMLDGVPVGGVCTRVHPEDQRGGRPTSSPSTPPISATASGGPSTSTPTEVPGKRGSGW
jgi:acetyltransferase, GNAT family